MSTLFVACETHLFDSITDLECSFLFHKYSFDKCCFVFCENRPTPHAGPTGPHSLFVYLPLRGLNDLTVLRRAAAKGTNGFAAIKGRVPPKPSGARRFTGCPVSRSIARIDNSSTGATIVIA